MISNFTAPAFLANATNLTVSDLVLDNFNVGGNSHVGTLVNTLKGSSTFTNVTVSNSSATTSNGAAGGVVGYIVRANETDRTENMEVKFDGCSIIGSEDMYIATGSLAEGKFVGLLSGYDNGEKLVFTDCSADYNTAVADHVSRYVEGNESEWQSGNDYTLYDGFLGDEKYLRAKVYFGGETEASNRFCPKWDGKTNVSKVDIEPLLANATYDAGTTAGANRFVVYSAFDLAGVRKKTASPAAIYLKADVDMNGQGADGKFNVPSEFSESAYRSIDDNYFNSFSDVSTLEGFNHTIYNLKIEHLAQGSTTAAFIGGASGITYHRNITFDGCCVVSTHKEVETDAKAYGAIICCNVGGNYNMSDVKVVDSKVFALQKIGTICAVVYGTTNFTNCSVDNCYIENYKCLIEEDFSNILTEKGLYCAKCIFYPYGEVGGFIGFLSSKSKIEACKVNNTKINCYGQENKKTRMGLNALFAGYYNIPGRHVNQFIGDIRTQNKEVPDAVTIINSSASGNTYSRQSWNHSFNNTSSDLVGCAYSITYLDNVADVTINNKTIELRTNEISLWSEMALDEMSN